MKIKTFGHFFNEGLHSVVRNKLMSVASVITVTAALFIFGIFMALVLNINNISNQVTSRIEIRAYLKNNPSISEQHAIMSTITSIKGVTKTEFSSKDQALMQLKSWLGNNKSLAEGLENDNPLPASYLVKVDDPSSVGFVAGQLKEMNLFEKIVDGKTDVDKLIKILGFIRLASFILIIILGIVSMALIANTIKLTVFARKKEIGIMKYIGATDWFIRWPFVIEGVTLGLIGAVIAVLLIWISYAYASNLITKNLMLFDMVTAGALIHRIGFSFCMLGIVIGGVGSGFSIRKFLVK
jgi:cell division transport system permease protein